MRRDRRMPHAWLRQEGPATMFGTLHPDEIEDMLFAHHVGHLACISEGKPYIVPIIFAYDGGAIYGHTIEGRKIDALRSRPEAALSFDERRDPTQWRSVVVEGAFEEVTDPGMRQQAIDLLATSTPRIHAEDSGVVFRINLAGKSGRWLRFEE
jgi:hypothetical protein